MTETYDLKSMLPEEVNDFITSLGLPKYRSAQLMQYLKKGIYEYNDMHVLPGGMREKLQSIAPLYVPELVKKQISEKDGTAKYLWRLIDGETVETVLMRYSYGTSVCISSQVGCRQGCAFCASTIGGLSRNLTAGEMLDEILFTELDAHTQITHVDVMGIGEPFDNYDQLVKFLRLVNHPDRRGISMRHITVSTCGVVPKILALAELDLQITLAVSLHAPDNATRDGIMPVNRVYKLEDLIHACTTYYSKTGRRVSFEYALICGVNDSQEQAVKLSKLAARSSAHVNLIRLNHVEERNLLPSDENAIRDFCAVLDKNRCNYTIRRSLGGDVSAACGQLRRQICESDSKQRQ